MPFKPSSFRRAGTVILVGGVIKAVLFAVAYFVAAGLVPAAA